MVGHTYPNDDTCLLAMAFKNPRIALLCQNSSRSNRMPRIIKEYAWEVLPSATLSISRSTNGSGEKVQKLCHHPCLSAQVVFYTTGLHRAH
ncbi:hypothetical protein KI387_008014, partial [Taxus chinensis]